MYKGLSNAEKWSIRELLKEKRGAWGTDRADRWLPSEIANEIDAIFSEYYDMTK